MLSVGPTSSNRPLSRRLDRCDRVIQNESSDPNGGNMCTFSGAMCRGDRGWLSHGLVVTLAISYSLDGGTLWGFTRDMRIAD